MIPLISLKFTRNDSKIYEEWFQNFTGMILFLQKAQGMIPRKFSKFKEWFLNSKEWFPKIFWTPRNDSSKFSEFQGMIPRDFLNSKEWFLKNSRIPRNDSSKLSELQGMIPQIFKNCKEWFLKIFWTPRNDSSKIFEYQGMIPQIQSWKNQDIFVNLLFSVHEIKKNEKVGLG